MATKYIGPVINQVSLYIKFGYACVRNSYPSKLKKFSSVLLRSPEQFLLIFKPVRWRCCRVPAFYLFSDQIVILLTMSVAEQRLPIIINKIRKNPHNGQCIFLINYNSFKILPYTLVKIVRVSYAPYIGILASKMIKKLSFSISFIMFITDYTTTVLLIKSL